MSNPTKIQRVLIVDDEPDLLGVLGELFTLFGYEVMSANNGADAFDLMQNNEVDVLLTDVRMPKMDGLELVRRVRSTRRERPIIMVTSGYSDHLPEALYEAGANGFLSKPFGASGVRDAFMLASVTPGRRWAQARVGGTHPVLARELSDVEVKGELSLGAGGMFWSLTGPAPRLNQIVEFKVTRAGAADWSGQGIVRWTRTAGADLPAGCGIEFVHLDTPCRDDIVARIERAQPTAFLPRL